jgi:DNA-directed RNA polymerase subunit E'/Rpb7
MEPVKTRNPQYRQREIRTVYSLSQITKKIGLPITAIGRALHQTIETTIASMIEGKCIVEGYVKQHSVRVITYSSGTIKGTDIIFDVVFECEVCFPVAGMLFNCVAKNITKAGIRAESVDENPSPFVLFIARDHYYDSDYFNSIEENEKFVAKVIAQRFELNDKYVSIIAELVTPKRKDTKGGPTAANAKPRIDFEE